MPVTVYHHLQALILLRSTSMNIYISNKYTNWYYSIINIAKNRNIEGYTEKHHIIPRSLGGSNDAYNLVALYPREHYICHLLLTKMVTGNNKYKMIYAAWTMARTRTSIKINSRMYSILREKQAECSRQLFTGRKLSEEHKNNISKGGKGRIPWNKGLKGSIPWNKGTKCPEHSERLRGKKPSLETRDKMRQSRLGKPPSNKGVPHSEETIQKMKNRKPIYVTRICDRKVMLSSNFANWNKRFL